MIICPNCKEEIDDRSPYCDQCGQKLSYCSSCGRPGMGRRCTHCGGLMMDADDGNSMTTTQSPDVQPAPMMNNGIPTLTLYNPSLNIRIVGINGAIIGRREGPYTQLLEGNRYVSGTHAQLVYNPESGWNIIDKHSSNGTKLNQRDVMPDIPMSIKSGDIVTLANINLQVSIS